MSTYGILHTAVSTLPVFLGGYALLRTGAIDLRSRVGRLYFWTMLVGTVSGFGFLPTRGFTAGQALGIASLVTLGAAAYTIQFKRRAAGYAQTLAMSFSYLLLMIFTTTETLTRLPRGNPFAATPESPELMPVRLGLFLGFLALMAFQVRAIRRTKPLVASEPFSEKTAAATAAAV